LFLHAAYSLIGEFFKASTSKKMAVAATWLCLYVASIPSVYDAFFWQTSAFNYPITFIYWAYFVVCLNRFSEYTSLKKRAFYAFCACSLIFFIVGSNEAMMLFIIGFLTIIGCYKSFSSKKMDFFILFLWLEALLCAYFVMSAPGNTVRMEGNSFLNNGISVAALKTVKSLVRESFRWIFFTPLLPFTVLFFALLNQSENISQNGLIRTNRAVVFLSFVVLVGILFFAIHYGIREGIPGRVMNLIVTFFLAGWFFNCLIWSAQTTLFKKITFSKPLILLTSAWILQMMLLSPTVRLIYSDLLSGKAYRYSKEMKQRFAEIEQSTADSVYLAPLKDKPLSLHCEDIRTDEKHLWNRCYAKYFHKKKIVLTGE